MSVEIRPVPVPDRLGTTDAAEFESYAALGFALERANWGHDDFAESAASSSASITTTRTAVWRSSAPGTAAPSSDARGSVGSATRRRPPSS